MWFTIITWWFKFVIVHAKQNHPQTFFTSCSFDTHAAYVCAIYQDCRVNLNDRLLAGKLCVPVEMVQHGVEGLMFLMTESSKHMVTHTLGDPSHRSLIRFIVHMQPLIQTPAVTWCKTSRKRGQLWEETWVNVKRWITVTFNRDCCVYEHITDCLSFSFYFHSRLN